MGQTAILGACAAPQERYHEIRCRDCLRGSIEITGARDAVGAATRVALAEALAGLVRASGVPPDFHVEVTRSVDWNQNAPRRGDTLQFAYSVRFPDEEAADIALAFLEQEMALNGRARFLPRFVAGLVAHGVVKEDEEEFEDEAWHANMRVRQWTAESVWIPGKGRKAHDSIAQDIEAVAIMVSGTLSCMQSACDAMDAQSAACCEYELVETPTALGNAWWGRHDSHWFQANGTWDEGI